jgi:Gluconate 2-dehydrogenase subunit 3
MGEKVRLPVAKAAGVGRREVLQGLFAGVGAGFVLPGGVEAHTMEPAFQAAVAKAKTPAAKPVFLDAHQFATVGVLCTRIVPGSDKALTDRFIDELLAVADPERQQKFLTALGAIEGASLSRFQKPFRAVTEAQQVEVLEEASTAKAGRVEWTWTPGTLLQPPSPDTPEVLTLRDHFDHLKGWIASAYYSSEIGLKELGYTGQMFFQAFPDCTHPEHS